MKKLLLAALIAVILFLCPKPAASSSPEDVAQYLMLEKSPQVLMLTPPSRHDTGGTGFSLRAPSGRVVTMTNAHICEMQEDGFVAARIPGTNRWINIRVLEVAKDTDLCILEQAAGASGLSMADELKPYSPVYVLGHPLLEPLRVSSGNLLDRETIQIGEESDDPEACKAKGGEMKEQNTFFGVIAVCVTNVDSFPISNVIYPGNSGSPMMNASGEVVGVVFAADRRTNQGFAIPFDVLQKFIKNY